MSITPIDEKNHEWSFNDIKVFENVINPVSGFSLFEHCKNVKKWGIQISAENGPSKGDTPAFWIFDFDSEDVIIQKIFDQVKEKIGTNFEIKHCYVNGQSTYQDADLHHDARFIEDQKPYTFLVYINPVWKPKWGGCTVFVNKYVDENSNIVPFNKQDGLTKSLRIEPRPNTGILFPSHFMHYAEGPSRHYNGIRMTLALKLRKVD